MGSTELKRLVHSSRALVGVPETSKLDDGTFQYRFAVRSEHGCRWACDSGVDLPAPTNELVEHLAVGFRNEQHLNHEKPVVFALRWLAYPHGRFEAERLARISRIETFFIGCVWGELLANAFWGAVSGWSGDRNLNLFPPDWWTPLIT